MKQIDLDNIGTELRRLRTNVGLTQIEVAKRLNISVTNYIQMEKSTNKMYVGRLLRALKVMGFEARLEFYTK